MKDRIMAIWNQHRLVIIAVVACLGIGGYAMGCQSKTESPFSGKPVTRAELDSEVDGYNASMEAEHEVMAIKTEAAYADLDEQDAIKIKVADAIEQVAGPALGAYAAPVFGLLSLGLGADVARQRRKVRLLSEKT